MFPQVPQPLHNSSIEQSLQFLVANSQSTNAKLDQALLELKDMKARVIQVETDVKHAFAEIFELKDKLNAFGLPISEEEKESCDPQKAAAKLAYERLLRPILSAAKDKGLISTLPHLPNIVSEAFRLNSKRNTTPASTTQPPPILL
jgi:hypothetical protein